MISMFPQPESAFAPTFLPNPRILSCVSSKPKLPTRYGAHDCGASLRQHQVFLGVSRHPGINHHNRNAELKSGS
jgi:hypothetical protein